MADVPPVDNDPVLIRTQKIIIGGIRSFAGFTNDRILILDEESGPVREEIPFSSIRLVSAGENTLREPILTVSYTVSGNPVSRELIFVRNYAGLRAQERDRCIEFLVHHAVPVAGEPSLPEKPREIPVAPEQGVPQPATAVPMPPPEIPRGGSPSYTIAVVIIIAAIVIAGAIAFGSSWRAGPGPVQVQPPGPAGSVMKSPEAPTPSAEPPVETPAGAPVETPAVSPGETPAVSPGETAPPATAPLVTEGGVPQSGIWVRIQYPGNYTGDVGAEGYALNVNASGDQLYRIPIYSGIVEGTIRKEDLTGGLLQLGIYRDGAPVYFRSTTAPRGEIDFHATVPLTGGELTPTTPPTPVQAVPTPDFSLPDTGVPGTGIWVRVYSAGTFTGSVGAEGAFTGINSTGDQFYYIPVQGGMIEGSVVKSDTTGDPVVVAIYRNGTLVSRMGTVSPGGIVDIHVPV